jgi:FkbM family methyltransferase
VPFRPQSLRAVLEAGSERIVTIARYGLDTDVAIVASRNAMALRRRSNVTAKPDPAAPAEVTASRVDNRRVVRKLLARPISLLYRLVGPPCSVVGRRVRTFMIDDLRNDLWLEVKLGANHLDHQIQGARQELDRLRLSLETTNRNLAELVTRNAVIERDLAESLARLDTTRALLADRVETVRAVVQGCEIELLANREALTRTEAATRHTARRFATPVGPNELLIRCERGYVVCPAEDVRLVAALVENGDLEVGTRLLIERLLRPGDVFVDAGAHIGLHTVAAARSLQGAGRVIAIEPHPTTASYLGRTIALNNVSELCTVHQVALGDTQGPAELYIGPTAGHNSLMPMVDDPDAQGSSIQVQVVLLDEVVPDDMIVDVLKLDVEGSELAVLSGATAVLDRSPMIAIIAEFGPSHLQRAGTTTQEWLNVFLSRGMEWRVIDPLTGLLERSTVEALASVESVNVFFANPGAPAWDRASA